MSLPALEKPLKLLEQKDIDAAIEALEEKVSKLPAHLTAHVLLARAYEAQQHWDRALRSWENAHILMPNSPIVEEGKKRVLRRLDDAENGSDRSAVAAGLDTRLAQSETSPTEDDPAERSEGEPDATEENDDLAKLRRWAEQEARRGGARPELSDELSPDDSSSPSSDEPPSTPEEQIEKFEEGSADKDLERLIDDLESAQIEPDPDAEETPPPDPENDTGDVVSETLARIHENQNDYQEAARIYSTLASQDPDRADEFQQKAAEMREKADAADEEE